MGYRLSKIYTRTGDDGTTGLADGNRIPKDALRVEAMGTVDELNAHIGLLIEYMDPDDALRAPCQRIQHQLFDLGGELAIPGSTMIREDCVTWLEESLDAFNADLPALKNFILPGGSRATAQCHLARSVCRRAERVFVSLGREEPINATGATYLNRLSDWLFVAARVLARREGAHEVLWESDYRGE